jgi:UDPglucose--hexose-1-phosphate uridylyltransferase
MHRTRTTLADGRELLYYDDAEPPSQPPPDRRDLAASATSPEMRYDALVDEWVAIAEHRMDRTHLPPSGQCPLCPSTADRLTEIPATDYGIVVFENRFPSFAAVDETGVSGGTGPAGAELFARKPAAGRCEVICFTSDHNASFANLKPDRARVVIDVLADRTTELNGLPYVEQVFPFENRGEEIGVTLHHPHGQIYAYPYVPPRTRQILAAARRHRDRTGGDLFADMLAGERRNKRIIAAGEQWTAFVPAAARWPVEVHIVPHREVPDLPSSTDTERDELASIYLDVLQRLDRLYGAPLPYVAAWHQAPARVDRDLARLHLQIFSVRRAAAKLKYLAGSESAMGAWVNDAMPEEIARRLREATG